MTRCVMDKKVRRCGECGRAKVRRAAFNGAAYRDRWECPRCERVRPDPADEDEANRLDDITRHYEDDGHAG